jgi:large subunit ribosomal protein L29
MKVKELRNLSREEMKKKVAELEEELFNLRFQAKMGQLANGLQLRMIRRTIARAKTILAQTPASVVKK